MKKIGTRQLSEIVGLSISNLYVYKTRGKLNILKEHGMGVVDIDDPLNEKFIAEQTYKRGNVVRSIDIIPAKEAKKPERKKAIPKVNDKERKHKEKKKPEKPSLIKAVTEFDQHKTEKMKQDAEIAKLRLAQLTGRVVPLDQAQMLFGLHFANVSSEFYNAIDNYTVIVVDKLGGSRKDLSEFRAKLKKAVNTSIDLAKEKTKTELHEKAREYTKSRRIGDVE